MQSTFLCFLNINYHKQKYALQECINGRKFFKYYKTKFTNNNSRKECLDMLKILGILSQYADFYRGISTTELQSFNQFKFFSEHLLAAHKGGCVPCHILVVASKERNRGARAIY